MNKTELHELATTYGKLDEINKLSIVNERKDGPTIADYKEVLEKFKTMQNEVIDNENKELEKVKEEGRNENRPLENPTKPELVAMRVEDLMITVPVIVMDHMNHTDVKEDNSLRGERFTWGNSMGVGQTETVFRHGRTQQLTKGMLKRLRRIMIPDFETDEKGNRIPKPAMNRFTISPGEIITEDKLAAMKKAQAVNDLG